MSPVLFGLLAIVAAQSGGPVKDLSALPMDAPKKDACVCAAEIATDVVIITGLVVDAELTLGPDGLSTNERQATVFDVSKTNAPAITGRTKVWHSTNLSKCGVLFDYGKKYEVAARKTENGALETDRCLMAGRLPDVRS